MYQLPILSILPKQLSSQAVRNRSFLILKLAIYQTLTDSVKFIYSNYLNSKMLEKLEQMALHPISKNWQSKSIMETFYK